MTDTSACAPRQMPRVRSAIIGHGAELRQELNDWAGAPAIALAGSGVSTAPLAVCDDHLAGHR